MQKSTRVSGLEGGERFFQKPFAGSFGDSNFCRQIAVARNDAAVCKRNAPAKANTEPVLRKSSNRNAQANRVLLIV
ncbi:hypothetical protein DWQ65_12565 [Treponema phagedenis]|nr:hypothetical protein HMPREF9554_02225 [Treponema phagedenis F0421]QSH93686.1 hypothetical protein C5O78_01185 [Treponema phagedenis]QSI00877.1 hypothetical protein DWQ65_12565 [Treponema phagedenis]